MTRQQRIALSLLGFMFLAGELVGRSSDGGASTAMASLSYLGSSGLPRGMRNNNPGNIKIGASPWQGKIPVQANTDGVFEQFEAYAYGLRAMIKLLRATKPGAAAKQELNLFAVSGTRRAFRFY